MTTPLRFVVALVCSAVLSLPAYADTTTKKGGKAPKAPAKGGAATTRFVNTKADLAWVKNGAPLKGGVKTFKIGQVSQTPITVYRLWDSQAATTGRAREFGSYWAAVNYKPEATARSKLAVCYEFNHMDRLITCTLKPNAYVAYGPGQNVKCKDGKVLGGGPQQIVISNAEDLKNKGALVCKPSRPTGFTNKGFAPGSTAPKGSTPPKKGSKKKSP